MEDTWLTAEFLTVIFNSPYHNTIAWYQEVTLSRQKHDNVDSPLSHLIMHKFWINLFYGVSFWLPVSKVSRQIDTLRAFQALSEAESFSSSVTAFSLVSKGTFNFGAFISLG